jgi:ligand-binding SRPBCC domain-containing protein
MAVITVETQINAPIEVCFDLARDIGLHCQTAINTNERAIDGVTSGLIGLGESVTFEGVHFGIRQQLTSKVTEYDKPKRFVDEMTKGAFKSLKHIHEFIPITNGTLMKDTLIWISPFGFLGKMIDRLFLENYMKRFVVERNNKLKAVAENTK